ncbi:uncharacterized protein LOC107365856 [Tetranychus urticae]|uniref:Dipeptidase E n=1 Tax=Tetranychus urticae TaxID=32264 RepID=T1KNQ1_TETUR|nr:uncharacterized protein LOC107365856 [Tetranychus urticae]XP_025017398.1 uncharacterized protein LOC107365856 [Tetranychus urticae]
MGRRLLLLSNSTCPGQSYCHWCTPIIDKFLDSGIKDILFIPFAAVTISWDEYRDKVAGALQRFNVLGIHKEPDMIEAINKAQVICIGGGNSFNLLHKLHEYKLLDIIKKRVVNDGVPYIGWSAGSNVACPDIRTTNDMPIISPSSHSALDLFPFNINPHYTEKTIPNHGGESRKDRLNEAFAVKSHPIIALPEGTGIKVENDKFQFFRGDLPEFLPLIVKVWKKGKNGELEILEIPLEQHNSDWKTFDDFDSKN